ncbi:primosomal protein N' [bacterium]|nr:primosomal protein N' [bacterium]
MAETDKKILEIVISGRPVHKAYDYWVSMDKQVQIGDYVKVPFGRGSSLAGGWVTGIKDVCDIGLDKLKKVDAIFGEIIPSDLVQLGNRISEYYCCPAGTAFSCIAPVLEENLEKNVLKKVIAIKDREKEILRISESQKKVLEFLDNTREFYTKSSIATELNISISPLNTLIKKGVLEEIMIKKFKTPYKKIEIKRDEELILTEEQNSALENIFSMLQDDGDCKGVQSFLLYGVTGSGKTEIYLRVIDSMLKNNRDVIYLVPEISLTPQIVRILKERYGDLVAVYHSRLTKKERISEWLRIKSGLAKVAIGARSAVFSPFSNLGLIIVDEEGESSYKQGEDPRYETKKVANFRAELSGNCMVLMGSATPSIETFHASENSILQSSKIHNRVSKRAFPENFIVDMRQELKRGNRSIFSRLLLKRMRENLEAGEQTIIFHNRRAFSTFVFCRICGHEMRCPECELALKYYQSNKTLKCHYCDYKVNVPEKCPACSSRAIKYFGLGTEQLEFQIRKFLPAARILRVDSDSINSLKHHEKAYSMIKNKEVDIIVGTQMVSRGLHIPDITLVGIVAYDSLISLPDYHSCERSFGLITQVGGRAGRGEKPGCVIVQTYNPGHYTLQAFVKNSYQNFYESEIKHREKLFYPPFSIIANIVFSSDNEDNLVNFLEKFGNQFKKDAENVDVIILGPIPAPIAKIRGRYRWQMLLKAHNDISLKSAVSLIDKVARGTKYHSRVKIIIDIDPSSVL